MFGHDSLPSRIYHYDVLPPSQGEAEALAQISAMHRYRNVLCEIERERRDGVCEVLRTLCSDILRLEAEEAGMAGQLLASRSALAARNAEARKRRQTAEERGAVREIGCRLKVVRASLKAAKAAAFASEEVQTALVGVENRAHERSIAARANSSLYWGNYLQVEQVAKSMRKGAPPRFISWNSPDGNGIEGRIAVQLQGGLSVADVIGCDQRFRIVLTGSSTKPHAEAWVRVGSDAKKKPIWCVVPFTLHRPLPEGAAIKWVYLHRRRAGTHWRWSLSIVLSKDEWEKDARPDDGEGSAVGIDLGWRLLADGSLRVAYAVGSDGEQTQLTLSSALLRRWELAREMRGQIDVLLDEAKVRVSEWIASRPESASALPEWFVPLTAGLAHWRSPEKMRRLLNAWEQPGGRIEGDSEILAYLQGSHAGYDSRHWPIYRGWWKRHQFLKDSESGLVRRSHRMRESLYRNFVADLRRKYHVAHVEDTDWSRIAKRDEVEEAGTENETARRHRQIAAPGRLSEIIRETFAKVVVVPALWTTQRCCDCGKIDAFDAAAELVRKCRHCEAPPRDQDERAALNLLASGEVVNEVPSTARETQVIAD